MSSTPTGHEDDDRDRDPYALRDDELRPGATAARRYEPPAPPPQYPPQQPPPVAVYTSGTTVAPSNGVATAGGVLGIIAAAISWVPILNFFSLILSILAVALGAVGWKRANDMQRDIGRPIGRGMAITGVVIGALGLIIAALFIAALGSALSEIGHSTPSAS